MLTQGESVEVHALRQRGWSVSAIARHLGRDRKTVRAYLSGRREPGRREPAGPDRFEPFERYCRLRFGADPHLWATTLLEESLQLSEETGEHLAVARSLLELGIVATDQRELDTAEARLARARRYSWETQARTIAEAYQRLAESSWPLMTAAP